MRNSQHVLTALAVAGAILSTVYGVRADATHVQVHDGDTMTLDGTRWRLWGVDAPEIDQACAREDGQASDCGLDARDRLRALVGSAAVSCTSVGRSYDRVVGRCYAGTFDLSAEMVRSGLALDWRRYSRGKYAALEADARAHRRGIWSGVVTPPWEWRQQARQSTEKHRTQNRRDSAAIGSKVAGGHTASSPADRRPRESGEVRGRVQRTL